MFISHSCQVKELQKQTGVRIKVVAGNEDSENKEAVILIEESFASGQVSILQYFVSLYFFCRPAYKELQRSLHCAFCKSSLRLKFQSIFSINYCFQ